MASSTPPLKRGDETYLTQLIYLDQQPKLTFDALEQRGKSEFKRERDDGVSERETKRASVFMLLNSSLI